MDEMDGLLIERAGFLMAVIVLSAVAAGHMFTTTIGFGAYALGAFTGSFLYFIGGIVKTVTPSKVVGVNARSVMAGMTGVLFFGIRWRAVFPFTNRAVCAVSNFAECYDTGITAGSERERPDQTRRFVVASQIFGQPFTASVLSKKGVAMSAKPGRMFFTKSVPPYVGALAFLDVTNTEVRHGL